MFEAQPGSEGLLKWNSWEAIAEHCKHLVGNLSKGDANHLSVSEASDAVEEVWKAMENLGGNIGKRPAIVLDGYKPDERFLNEELRGALLLAINYCYEHIRWPHHDRLIELADEEEIPAAYRDEGETDGKPLTARYVAQSGKYRLSQSYITKLYNRGDLTRRMRVGNSYLYLYLEIVAASEKRDVRGRGRC